MKLKKGAQIFTVRDYLKDRVQFEESMKKIKKIGYESIQNGTPPFMTDTELKSMLDDVGLIPCSGYASFEAMNSDPEAIKKAIATAKVYGVKYIGIGTIPDSQRESVDGYKKFASDLNKIGSELKKKAAAYYITITRLNFILSAAGNTA